MSTPTNTFTKKCYVILNKKFNGLFSYFFNTLWWNCFIRYTFCSFYILVLIFANLSLKMYSVFNLRKKEIFLPWHYAVHLVAPPLLILLAWHFLKRLLLQVKKIWKTNKSESFVKSSTKRTLYIYIVSYPGQVICKNLLETNIEIQCFQMIISWIHRTMIRR